MVGDLMDKRALNKNIKESIKHSKGRFFAIMCLMMLGSFALVGLKVIGPDMRNTSDDYFAKKKLTDVSIISEYGLDGDDIEEIKNFPLREKRILLTLWVIHITLFIALMLSHYL